MSTIKQLDIGKWQARVRRSNEPAISKVFKTQAEAKQWVNKIEHAVDSGAGIKKIPTFTLKQTIVAYELEHPERNQTQKRLLRIACVDLGEFQISKLTSQLFSRYIKILLNTPIPPAHNKKPETQSKNNGRCYSKSTSRKIFYEIKKALIWHSNSSSYALPQDLFIDVEVPEPWEKSNDRRISKDEEKRILENAAKRQKFSESWPLLIRFALETAMRLQEMALAKWSHLTEDNTCLSIPAGNSKTNRARNVPLSTDARVIIDELRSLCPHGNELIFWEFEGDPSKISSNHRKILKASRIEGLTFYSYRHEALSRLASGGTLSISELMSISGHTNLITLQRYLRFYTSTTADKIDQGKENLRRLAESAKKCT